MTERAGRSVLVTRENVNEDMNERMKIGDDSRAEWKDNRYPAVAFSQIAMVEICLP